MAESRAAFVYRIYDSRGALLYVGACGMPHRLNQHFYASAWAGEIARIDMVRYPTRKEAFEEEKKAIAGEAPRFNVAGADGIRKTSLMNWLETQEGQPIDRIVATALGDAPSVAAAAKSLGISQKTLDLWRPKLGIAMERTFARRGRRLVTRNDRGEGRDR